MTWPPIPSWPNQEYGWLGHFTLLLTLFYVLLIAIVQLKPAQRILSFLALGTVLLAVSMIFSRRQACDQSGEKDAPPPD